MGVCGDGKKQKATLFSEQASCDGCHIATPVSTDLPGKSADVRWVFKSPGETSTDGTIVEGANTIGNTEAKHWEPTDVFVLFCMC